MSETLFTGARFRVDACEYEIPGKGLVRRELVVHPGAVAIVPILVGDRVVMIRNYRFAADAELLELPAGTLEPEEDPDVCAARELEEETGYAAGTIEPLGRFFTSPGFTNELMYVYVATDLTRTQQNLDDTEQIRVEIMALDDALAACLDGRIVDGKTIAALLAYDRRREGKA